MKSIKKDFAGKLKAKLAKGKFVCIELNPDLDRMPAHLRGHDTEEQLYGFLKDSVDATAKFAAAFKLNTAFFEKFGSLGVIVYEAICQYIHHFFPRVVLIGDANCGGIDNAGIGSSWFLFDRCNVDAVMINPYLGQEVRSFLDRDDKGMFILCRITHDGPKEMQRIQQIALHWPLLIQDVGSNYPGDLINSLHAALAHDYEFLVNSRDDILYASHGEDFAKAARVKAEELDKQIHAIVASIRGQK